MKKKVLHILNTGSYSGAENVVITIIQNTFDDFDSVYLSLDGSIAEILEEKGIAFFPVAKLSVNSIRRAIEILKPDIIHAHDFTAGILSTLSTGKIPIISHLHNNSPWIQKLGIKSIAYALSCLRYNKILTVSESIMKEYIFGNLFIKKSQVIGNPIDIHSIYAKIENIDLSQIEETDVLFLGRLSAPKNPLMFLDIVAELRKQVNPLSVSIIGDGEMRPQVESKIAALGLKNTVTLYGFKDNPYPFLAKCKVLCMPSVWEGFGLAAVEGLVFGKPVVSTPVGGLSVIVDESCGNLCKSRNEFVDILVKYLTDQEFYNSKSKGAFKKAKLLNNINDYIYNIEVIYKNTR